MFKLMDKKIRPIISAASVTLSYINSLVKPRNFFQVSGKIYNFMHFERHFHQKKENKIEPQHEISNNLAF